jgi:hypothetical protein
MFTIVEVTNLHWNNAEHSLFTADVKYAEFDEIHPTGVNATDPNTHIKELWEKGNAGEYGAIAEYVDPTIVTPIDVPVDVAATLAELLGQ